MIECVLDARAVLGEGPYWDATARRLYWVDIKTRLIHRFDPATKQDDVWPVAEDIGSLAVRERGGLIVALKSGFYFYDLASGTATTAVLPKGEPAENRFNDGKTDRQGRFWAGTMDDTFRERSGGLYRLDANLSCKKLVDGIMVSNALCWSPDSRVMYYADSRQRTVWAWDFAPKSGDISNRRVFIELPQGIGSPDGATVDADGFIWIAHWDGWRVVRYDPQGRVDRTIMVPVQRPTCPAFGGPKLSTMYLTSASIGLDRAALEKQPLAGGLFALDVGVKGLPEVPFKG